MHDTDTTAELNRREFTAQAIMALLGGVTITISSCSSGSGPGSPAGPSGPPPAGSESATVSANHGHTAVLEAAQLAAGSAITLQIRGSADHPHTVALSGPEVMQIAAGGRVSKTSSTDDAHNHVVTFN
jgi:hypothetical protein